MAQKQTWLTLQAERRFESGLERISELDEQKERVRRSVLVAAQVLIILGASVVQVAAKFGIRRQRMHEQLERVRVDQSLYPVWVLTALVAAGRTTSSQVASMTGLRLDVVTAVLVELVRISHAQIAVTEYGEGSHVAYYKATADGEHTLIQALSDPEDTSRYAVFFPFAAAEEAQLTAAAEEEFGGAWFAVLQPGTAPSAGQTMHELAFQVTAASPREAIAAASERYELVRAKAELPAEHLPPVDLVPLRDEPRVGVIQ